MSVSATLPEVAAPRRKRFALARLPLARFGRVTSAASGWIVPLALLGLWQAASERAAGAR